MKKSLLIVSLLVVASMLISACGSATQQPARMILDPNSQEALAISGGDPNAVTSIDNRPTLQQQYDACASGIDYSNPEFEFLMDTSEGQKVTQTWNCGVQATGAGTFVMVAADQLTKLTPTQVDNMVVYAVKIVVGVGVFAVLMYGAYVAGQQLTEYNTMAMIDAHTLGTINLEVEIGILDPFHDPAHDVDSEANLPKVKTLVTVFATWVTSGYTGGPRDPKTNRDFVCRALVIAGKIARYTLWAKTNASVLVWSADGTWITFFEGKALNSINNVPQNIANKFKDSKMQPVDCSTLPPFPPLPG